MVKGKPFYKNKLVLPATSALISLVLHECHDSSTGGHSDVLKTLKRVSASLYLQGMKKFIQAYVAAYSVCQHNKHSTLSPVGLLQPLPVLHQIWEDLSLDFIEGLPESNGYDTILVVVDRLSKYAHFIGLKHPYTTVTVATAFVQEIVRLHGTPRSIISDHDKIFLSKFWGNSFNYKVQRFILVQLITLNPTTKLKCSTDAWRHTCVVLSITNQNLGLSIYQDLNIGITLLSTQPRKPPLSVLCMAEIPHLS